MIKHKSRGIVLVFLIALFGVMISPLSAEGADSDKKTPAGFTVESILPENQLDTTKTYYYLGIEPNKPQTIQVKVISLQKEPVTVKLAVHDAVSSSVGAIDYAQANPKLDSSLKNPLTSFVTIKDNAKEVTVTNFEEKIVTYQINPPKESFPGVKLGSLRFVKKIGKSEKKKNGLTPEYAYVIAMMLNEDGSDFNHGADLHLKKANLQLSNGKKVVAANIQNDQPKVLREMKIEGWITKKGERKKLYKREMTDFSVAPTSNFNFEIPLGIEKTKPGTYVFHGKAKGDGKTWRWDKEFTIGEKAADTINEEAAYKATVPKWVPLVAGLLILCFFLLVLYLTKRTRKLIERE